MNSANEHDSRYLGQYIPPHYHFNMLRDSPRMHGFKRAIEILVKPGARVLELGGGTGILSFFAAKAGASKVWCVEMNPPMLAMSRRLLAMNHGTENIEVVEADAMSYMPPEPVEVVICEMLHVGLLREKQVEVIQSFKDRYWECYGALPQFIPGAAIQAVQPISCPFQYLGYHAPAPVFQDPLVKWDDVVELGQPVLYQMFQYDCGIPEKCLCDGEIQISADGEWNALRFITKNVLAIEPDGECLPIEWFNQYLILPLAEPVSVRAGEKKKLSFSYLPGGSIESLADSIQIGHI